MSESTEMTEIRQEPTEIEIGRPPHEPTDDTRAEVRKLASCGATQGLVARVLGISEPTLRKHYREELDLAIEWAQRARRQGAVRQGARRRPRLDHRGHFLAQM